MRSYKRETLTSNTIKWTCSGDPKNNFAAASTPATSVAGPLSALEMDMSDQASRDKDSA